MSALWRAVLATRPRWRLALFAVLLGTGAVAAAIALLTLSGYLISRAAERPEILALSTAIVGVRFFGISRAVLRYLERLVSHDLAFRTLTDQRVRFFRRLIPLVPGGLPRSSDVLSRFVADADRLQDLYLRALSPPVVAVLAGLGAILAAWLILPAGALVVAAVLVAAGVAAPLAIRFTARRAGRRQATARASLAAVMVEIGDGAAELAVFGREADWEERAATASGRLSRVARGDALAGGLAVGTAAALTAGAAAAMAAVAIPAVDSGALDSVLLAAIVLLAFASVEAVAPLGAAAASLDAVADAATRLEEITERVPPSPGEGVPGPGALEARGVRFRYGEDWVLDGVDLRVEPGQAVALVGPSGVGKTTLAELLVRFRDPEEGAVLLGGVDVRELDPEALRAAVRLGGQDAYLFDTTIRANVALAKPEASDEEIVAALQRVGLGEWLESLPEGLETPVGEHGAEVSGGQRQRLAAARLFVCDARILIFDEPTTHLDPAGAEALLRTLVELAHSDGKGVLVITHERDRLSGFDAVVGG